MQTRTLLLISCIVFGLVVSLGFAGDRYQDWIEKDVHWIASKAEKETFQGLTDDEARDGFIERFWRRRDPTPGTPANEYKEEHYRRLEYVAKSFREGIAGWRTDRGRIYLIHGPPDLVEHVTPDGFAEQDTVIWTYFNLRNASYARGRLVVVFKAKLGMSAQDVTLGESSTGRARAQRNFGRGGIAMTEMVQNALRYRVVAAGPPAAINRRGVDIPASGIGEYTRYLDDLLGSPGELLEARDNAAQREQANREEMRQFVSSSISYSSIPFDQVIHDFYEGAEGNLIVSWQVPLKALQFQKEEGVYRTSLDLIAQVKRPDGQLVDEFFKSIDLSYPEAEFEQQPEASYYYQNYFSVDPGHYQVTSILRESSSGGVGSATGEAECLTLEADRIALSGLVLSQGLQRRTTGPSSDTMALGEWSVVPESDLVFSDDDQLVIFFKIYNPQPMQGDQVEVIVNYDFIKDGEVVRTSGPRRVSEFSHPERRTVDYSSLVDLADFPPGEYLIQVNAIDYQTKKYALRRAQFSIQ